MTFKINGFSGLTFPDNSTQAIGGLTTTNPQSGGVIQVVSVYYPTTQSQSSQSYIDTGLTATITPKFSTSKILILLSIN